MEQVVCAADHRLTFGCFHRLERCAAAHPSGNIHSFAVKDFQKANLLLIEQLFQCFVDLDVAFQNFRE
jgi:hypothetical protein